MKNLTITMLLVAFTFSVSAQKLIDKYKKGVVRLIPDTEYARDNNWGEVFKSYYDTIYNTPIGNRKSLILLPDGSAVVNHAYRDYYTKFSPNGKFEKEFGIKNSKGERFKKIKPIHGIINNNTFFTGLDNMGNMICFDFDGNYIKTMKLDYMARQMIPLPNNKIAVVGWVLWSTKIRDFVAIVDYETNKQKVIWEHYTTRNEQSVHKKLFNYVYRFKKGGAISFTTMPYSKVTGLSSPPQIASVEKKLVIAVPTTGEILVYDSDGNLKFKDKIEWDTNYISVPEQKEIQQKAIDRYKSLDTLNIGFGVPVEEKKLALEFILKQMEADLSEISDPIPIPTFSTIIKDSDGNLLFFEFPKEENTNKFNVWIYQNEGKFVCQSSLICDEYKIKINPSTLVFYNGYIYALANLKNTRGIPLRLVRFKITSN
jgi:hypothetical protein